MSIIEITDLSKNFGSKIALNKVSLSVNAGEIFVLIGPSGCGKTTLLRLIDQLEKSTSGKIHLNGLEISHSNESRTEARRKISMVFQRPVVFNDNVFNNVAYPLKIRHRKKDDIFDKVVSMLKKVGLEGYEKRNARTLSGGETQKVALARALVTNPMLLLLDEPTANLDPLSLNQIESLILQLHRDLGITMIMSTHEMQQGQRLATRIGVMMNGEMVQVGTPSEIFSAPGDMKVAQFVGMENLLSGTIESNKEGLAEVKLGDHSVIEVITARATGDKVQVGIRPEDIIISNEVHLTSARNAFNGIIKSMVVIGPLARVELDCGFLLISLITKRSAEELHLSTDKKVRVSFKATAVHIMDSNHI